MDKSTFGGDLDLASASSRLGRGARCMASAPYRNSQVQYSDSRKEQNREASRKYRQRRKQRLALLDQLLASSEPIVSEASESTQAVAQDLNVLSHDGRGDELLCPPESIPDFSMTGPYFLSNSIAAGDNSEFPNLCLYHQRHHDWSFDLSATLLDTPLRLDESSRVHEAASWSSSSDTRNIMSTSTATPSQLALPWPALLNQEPVNFGTGLPAPVALGTEPRQREPMAVVAERLQDLSLAQKYQIMSLLKVETAQAVTKVTQSEESGASESTAFSPCKATFNALIHMKSEVKSYESWLRTALTTNQSLPDPKLNSIRIMRSSFYAAILANSTAIGLFNYEVLNEDGLSPFNIDDKVGCPPSQVAATRARFATRVPQSLAPCDVQLTFPHHPYLDVIPFSEFRQRAVAALTCHPPLFDEEEMCHDLDAEGLICWGSQPANSEKRGIEMEVPWDPRSWEPQTWFLEKYWFLVGGLNGEMHTSARLWASRRGERL
ncbi:hypothetical protein B0T10DRAFT_295794 [Thelonectria olida]|uniref:BZIP domain-containing protein n=1 Tax=Thelonectria olida TaxID=1576542 RepID=A0A9P9ARW6_9HYPO|nr:hypothetical protein B0T10DRAFT_295794 [Thelonectria olida]